MGGKNLQGASALTADDASDDDIKVISDNGDPCSHGLPDPPSPQGPVTASLALA